MLLAVLNTFLPAVALALATWLGLRVLRVNAATRYWAWWAVLGAVVAMPLWPEREAAPVAAIPMDLPASMPAPVVVDPGTNWLLWAVVAWAVFAAYRLARIAISFVHLRRVKAGARLADFEELKQAARVRRTVRLLVSEEAGSPMAVGFLRPAVIVPGSLLARLSEDERDYVLLHELAHVARWDDWMNLLARVAGAFVGLHPVAAFALGRIAKERELACDDWVVAATGEVKQYAASLARVIELSRGRSEVLATGITGSHLGDRVEQLLAQGRRFTKGASVVTVSMMAAALAGMTVIGAQSPALVAFAQAPRLALETNPTFFAEPQEMFAAQAMLLAQAQPAEPTPARPAAREQSPANREVREAVREAVRESVNAAGESVGRAAAERVRTEVVKQVQKALRAQAAQPVKPQPVERAGSSTLRLMLENLNEMARVRTQLEAAAESLPTLEAALAQKRAEMARAVAEIARAQTEVRQLEEQLLQLQRPQTSIDEQIKVLRNQLERLERQRGQQPAQQF